MLQCKVCNVSHSGGAHMACGVSIHSQLLQLAEAQVHGAKHQRGRRSCRMGHSLSICQESG